jgi:hypothetical protein
LRTGQPPPDIGGMRTLLPTVLLIIASHATLDASLWFAAGHRVVARLAEDRLSPAARAAVADLLHGEDLADVSSWADLIRGTRRSTGPWHFVNIPIDARRYDPARDCPRSCIVSALDEQRRILRDSSAGAVERAEALKYVVHFIGDLHQPLHVADKADRGGNQTQLQFFGKGTNLHQVWDGMMVERSGVPEQAWLSRLRQLLAGIDAELVTRGTIVDWAMEGHAIAQARVYRSFPGRQVTESYVTENLAVIDSAIVRAGIRLAAVLNEDLASYRTGVQARSLGDGRYRDTEAAAHVGEIATVVGTVVQVTRAASGSVYLNFGAPYPRQTFAGAILAKYAAQFTDLDRLKGRTIEIRGLIKLYRGQPEILLEEPGQLVVREAQSAGD